MNSKNYIKNITNGFCEVVRQLYIDKKDEQYDKTIK